MEVLNGIRYVRPGDNFQPKMKLFKKIDVNGDKEHPLFSYLKVNIVIMVMFYHCYDSFCPNFANYVENVQSCCPSTREYFEEATKLYYTTIRINDIRWNFEKFLINRQGIPVMRYDAMARVSDMREAIEQLVKP
jgi:glutathione peroxidase